MTDWYSAVGMLRRFASSWRWASTRLPAGTLLFFAITRPSPSPSVAPRQGMEDIHRVAQVQAVAQPSRRGRVRVDHDALRLVPGPDRLLGIGVEVGGRRHVRNRPAAGTPELEFAVRPAFHPEALLVHRAVVAPAQQGQVRER